MIEVHPIFYGLMYCYDRFYEHEHEKLVVLDRRHMNIYMLCVVEF